MQGKRLVIELASASNKYPCHELLLVNYGDYEFVFPVNFLKKLHPFFIQA